MFCEKCGREIPEDSLFCNYCGVKIEPEQRELDWEEAARLRESRENQKAGAVPRSYDNRNQYDPGCVTPGAPRKTCAVCGRSLPASTVEDLCALCTMRRQQEEESWERQRELAEYQRAVAAGEKDRYDVSDEYDWDALQGTSPSGGRPQERAKTKNEQPFKKKKGMGCATLAIILVLLMVVPNVIKTVWGNINYQNFGLNEEPITVSTEDEAPFEDEYPDDDGDSDQAEGEAPWAAVDWQDNTLDGKNYNTWVRPIVEWAVESCLPLLSDTYGDPVVLDNSETWYTDGVRNRVTGWILSTDASGESGLTPFDTVLLIAGGEPGDAGYVLCFQADGQVLFDDLDAVDREGRITEAGSYLFENYDTEDFPMEGNPPADFSK